MSIQGVNGAAPLPPRPVVVRPGQAADTPTAEPVDAVVSQPTPWTAADIRKLVATPGTDHPRVNPEQLPFGVEIEMEGYSRAAAKPIIDALEPWDVKPDLPKWSLVHDGSVPGSSGGTGGEAISPPMILEGGRAEAQIRTVLKGLAELGAHPSMACGLHIHVDASALGPRGMATLMRMAMEQERALFRISQNGDPQHRGALNKSDPFHYCRPLSTVNDPFPLLHADSTEEFRNAFYTQIPSGGRPRPTLPAVGSNQPFRPDRYDAARYYGVNFNSFWFRGTVEFRVFNSTADPDKLLDDVRLAVGMVAAAANEDYTFLKSDTLKTDQLDRPVSREAFTHFLEKAVPDPGTRERLTRTFVEGGGTFTDDEPVEAPVAQAARLIERGQTFSADGKPLQSPFEVAHEIASRKRKVIVHTPTWSNPLASVSDLRAVHDVVDQELLAIFAAAKQEGHAFLTPQGTPIPQWNGRQPMTLVRPDGARFALDALESERMLAAIGGRADLLSPEIQKRFEHTSALDETGVRFRDAAGQGLSPLEAAVLTETDGRVTAERDEERATLGKTCRLEDLRADADADLAILQKNGVQFRIDGQQARWLPRIAGALSDGLGTVTAHTADGRTVAARSAADLSPLLVEIRREQLDADQRAAFDTLRTAARRADITFSTAGQPPVAADSDEEFKLLTAPETALEVTVPALASTVRLAERGQIVTLASAATLVGPTLGPVLFRHIVPALARDVARSQHDPQVPRQLSGTLTVSAADGSLTRYQVSAVSGEPAVDIRGADNDALRVSLQEGHRLRLERPNESLTLDPRELSNATPGARHEIGQGLEWWSSDGGVRALLSQRPDGSARPVESHRSFGVAPGDLFQACATEESNITGYRVTNEVSTWFPKFTLRGGAYLGVGASQNYDHLTTVKADLAFLVDADPHVAADHRGMLALVGESRNAAHFLSMLMGTPLSRHEESLPVDRVFELLEQRGADAKFIGDTKAALATRFSSDTMSDVDRLLGDARGTFLKTWRTQATTEKQHRWLWEPDRFAHLRYLQQSGRVVVRCASVTGPATMKSIADQVASWNQNHYPPLTFSAIYLSNAEQWISQGERQPAAYPTLVSHLEALPLHPEGVILRTGGKDIGGVNPGASTACTWHFASLPMGRFQTAARVDPSYAAINRATRAHASALEAARDVRTQQITDTILDGLEAGGAQVEGPRQLTTLADGGLTIRTERGAVTPRSFEALLRAEKWLTGRDAEIAADFLPLGRAFERLQALGYTVSAAETPVGDALTLWENLQAAPVTVQSNGRTINLQSSQALIQLASIESGHIEDLEEATRVQLEGLRSLSRAGCTLHTSDRSTTLGAAYEALVSRRLVVSTPLGRYVNLTVDERYADVVAELCAEASGERASEPALRAALTALQAVGYTLGATSAPLSVDEASGRLAAGSLSLVSPLGGVIDLGHADELLAHLEDGLERGRQEQETIAARGEQPPAEARRPAWARLLGR